MRRRHWTLMPWFMVFAMVMLFMTMATYRYNKTLAYIELGLTGAAFALTVALSLSFRVYMRRIVKSAADGIEGFNSEHLEKYKYPVAVTGEKGDIIWCNARFRKNICGGRSPEGDNISVYISGRDIGEICDSDGVDVAADGREFTVFCVSSGDSVICHFIENTYYKTMVREYHANMPCVALITFDNADDFLSDSEESASQVTILVESALQRWAGEYNALYKRVGNNRYMIIFRESDVEKIAEQKFQILKEIREIKVNRYIATISVGLSRGCKTVKESERDARKALDMALGRGGDQVAVIKDNTYEFYGGTAVASERVSKVRMRVIANALSRAVMDSDKVYIMGHRFSDLDCVGAAVGLQCIVEKSLRRYAKIVINKQTSMAGQLIDYVSEKLDSDIFVTPEDAVRGVTQRTLLIIVDTHLKTSLESEELYDKCKRVIVIDHHRKAVNYIQNALVFCHEPSASSACEMCCEIIGCMDDSPLGYVQADALMSGIVLDTKNFVVRTGIRTFEAAAYLRKKGASTLTVKEMSSGSIDTYREKVDIVVRSQTYRGCAISTSELETGDIRLASAQAADEMLSLQGISASFVIFRNNGAVNISARSYGRINVQLIMEKLGGGGHQTMAATQLRGVTVEIAKKRLEAAINEVLDDMEEKSVLSPERKDKV